ncbi:UDP-N-acetylglucosamine 1-carboxyvinyltransferase [Desulfovibrio litoralis]|uniref:UDP-N-acetylglucosamine 1-carboxyvinyltransferase n=1 Tax=Desulfovibrio litoralis DSM 11393 TaxID=1121455 RepID=A0A1M7SAL1_9BACT|nr:UDP-N-acetylglucosamine 1-carboxyvinyltransferase [Desulfovibrio litoralis]SHN55434.1 UDP-N-acetylglucosamine 1-carboxyvinyltransferase [Desulfovibrio litoralis DSM 11393]
MEKLVIEGGTPLKGTIEISGSKNAALPILLSSILFEVPVTFHNVPRLRDINTTLKLLAILGIACEFTNNRVKIEPKSLSTEAPYELVKTMRASALVLGPLLARRGEAKVALPGGCAIGARPLDLHLSALEKMGAVFELSSGYIIGRCKKLKGADITFDFPTVGGTENLIMAASLAEGTTILRNAAREPEITDLANFLNSAGAKITGHGGDEIVIEGVSSLNTTTYSVMPDRIEAGTFMVAAGMTGGELLLKNCPYNELHAVIDKLVKMGLHIEKRDNDVFVKSTQTLKPVDIITRPFPGFPTDMQAQLMGLMCLADGTSTVEETIFENRFMHVSELLRMGAEIKLSGNQAVIHGVKSLYGAPVMASDLRASATLVLAGLSAKGTTEVQRIYHLDRGYEQIEKKLNAVGAKIKRVPE